jgi:hypothetical protein
MSSSGDSLVYELALETEGTKEPFVRQDWISILDNQATNYQSFQSVIDTSQLSNSDKWMNYREAFFLVPLLITAQGKTNDSFYPATPGLAVDGAIGLKNWFGSIIHSISVDLNGTTIVQQTQLINLINTFRLLTTLSWGDVRTIGSSIGFYPDDVDSIQFSPLPSACGQGFCNNGTLSTKFVAGVPPSQVVPTATPGTIKEVNTFPDNFNPTAKGQDAAQVNQYQNFFSGGPNEGFLRRNQWLTFDPDGVYSYNVCDSYYGVNTTSNPSDPTTSGNLPKGAVFPTLAGPLQSGSSSGTVLTSAGGSTFAPTDGSSAYTNIVYARLMSQTKVQQLWKSTVTTKQNGGAPGSGSLPQWQTSTMAKVWLKHIHPFFQKIPLTKGVFMRFTMYFNCCTVELGATASQGYGVGFGQTYATGQSSSTAGQGSPGCLNLTAVVAPINGIVPLMIASAAPVPSNVVAVTQPVANAIANSTATDWNNPLCLQTSVQQANSSLLGSNASRASLLLPMLASANPLTAGVRVNLSVGYKCLDNAFVSPNTGQLGQSVQLVLPAYTMNPVFESAYITNPIKNIKYIDYFQYSTAVASAGNNFNFLITNGIAGLREIVIFPFLAANQISNGTFATGYPWPSKGTTSYTQYQNPFDSCGGGTMLPLSMMTQFNVLLSGQNISYSTIRYSYEEYIQQFYGRSGAVNAGLTDGITSGLIDEHMWEMGYGAYYLDLSRMMAVEDSVPKSVSIQGTTKNNFQIQFVVFLGFEVSIGIDVITGARV